MAASEAKSDAHIFRAAADTVAIDAERLAAYLETIGLPLDQSEPIRQFGTGLANINYRLTAGGQRLVLRRPPDGDLPPGAHDMAREHSILSRLWKALPLAPRSVHLCEDRNVIDVPFQLIDPRGGKVNNAILLWAVVNGLIGLLLFTASAWQVRWRLRRATRPMQPAWLPPRSSHERGL